MAQPYLDQLNELVSTLDPTTENLTCKHFFSGAALYADGKICASLTPKGLAFKLPQDRCEQLIASQRAVPLRYFDNAPVKQSYALFADYLHLADSDIAAVFREAIEYVVALGE